MALKMERNESLPARALVLALVHGLLTEKEVLALAPNLLTVLVLLLDAPALQEEHPEAEAEIEVTRTNLHRNQANAWESLVFLVKLLKKT